MQTRVPFRRVAWSVHSEHDYDGRTPDDQGSITRRLDRKIKNGGLSTNHSEAKPGFIHATQHAQRPTKLP